MSSAERGRTGRVEPLWRWRRAGSAMLLVAALVLVPWIGYLAVTLPTAYEAGHWNLAWVGFDVVLLVLIATTAVLARRSHPMLPVTAFATGVLLVCDAWLDSTTSSGSDHTWALITALVVELPLAAVLLTNSLAQLRVGPGWSPAVGGEPGGPSGLGSAATHHRRDRTPTHAIKAELTTEEHDGHSVEDHARRVRQRPADHGRGRGRLLDRRWLRVAHADQIAGADRHGPAGEPVAETGPITDAGSDSIAVVECGDSDGSSADGCPEPRAAVQARFGCGHRVRWSHQLRGAGLNRRTDGHCDEDHDRNGHHDDLGQGTTLLSQQPTEHEHELTRAFHGARRAEPVDQRCHRDARPECSHPVVALAPAGPRSRRRRCVVVVQAATGRST
ncbi:MAG TPA: hypothetical protein VFP34_05860 [Microlunatus sp.]|nr:hypothetical protein [Microlunatus sp.]